MVANLPFNWQATTNAAGTFNVQSDGYVQGVYMDDPSIRNWLKGGIVSPNAVTPMFGGLGISDTIKPNTSIATNPPDASQGGIVSLATTQAAGNGVSGTLTGFTVFNQAYGMVITPQGSVPLSGSNQQIMYFRLGSGARIPVPCSTALSALPAAGDPVSNYVTWDCFAQQLVPYVATFAAATMLTGTYNSSTGVLALTFSAAPLGAGIAATANGYYLGVSGLTAAGGAGAANIGQLNTSLPIISTATAGTVINLQGPIGLGAITLTGATGGVAAGGGILGASYAPVRLEEIQIGNCMSVSFNPATGFYNWNYNGNLALITI